MPDYVTTTEVRVRYAETDQMGVAHHANYLIWCELGRTHHMRELGVSYRDLERRGIRLPVVEAHLRYRAPARYDDVLNIKSWVRQCGSRKVQFGNAIEETSGRLLATAQISLIPIDQSDTATSLPGAIRERLVVIPDPVPT